MKKYYYKAQTQDGSNSGLIEASSKKKAHEELLLRGCLVSQLYKVKKYNEKNFWNFIDALYSLLNQNMALSEALYLLASSNNGSISNIAHLLNEELSEGADFLAAMGKIFYSIDAEIISLMRIGYENADLPRSLKLIIAAKVQKSVLALETQKAITYPGFVFFVSIFVLVIIFDNVLPEFKILMDQDTQTSLIKFIMSFSGQGYQTVLYVLWYLIVSLFLVVLLRSTSLSKLIFEKTLNYLPILGSFLRMRSKLVFLENISLALSLKSDLEAAIQFAVRATKNEYHKLSLLNVKNAIFEGVSVEEALERTKLFDRMELLRIGLAEKSGTLPKAFQDLLDSHYQNQRKLVNFITQLIGPVAIIVLGVIIFFVAFAVVTPMMTLQQSVG
jgi:type II secretory pathway component PulF